MTRYNPDLLAKCPLVPTAIGVGGDTTVPVVLTAWESDQVQRHWRTALSNLGDLQGRLTDLADRLHNAGRHQVPPEAVQFDHRVQGGGITYNAMQAEAAMVQLARVIDGAVHRTAEAHHNARPERPEPPPRPSACGIAGHPHFAHDCSVAEHVKMRYPDPDEG